MSYPVGVHVFFDNLSCNVEEEFKEYVKMMTDNHAARGSESSFELHRFPSVNHDQFEIVIQAYGLKFADIELVGSPLVEFVEFDKKSEYYKTNLRHIVKDAQERRGTIIFRKSKYGNFVNRFKFVLSRNRSNEGIIGKEVDGEIVPLTDVESNFCVKNNIKMASQMTNE